MRQITLESEAFGDLFTAATAAAIFADRREVDAGGNGLIGPGGLYAAARAPVACRSEGGQTPRPTRNAPVGETMLF